MSTDYLTDKGLGHGRNWSALPSDGGPIEWTMDPDGDLIQGPLDLSFMRGQRFSLVLEPTGPFLQFILLLGVF